MPIGLVGDTFLSHYGTNSSTVALRDVVGIRLLLGGGPWRRWCCRWFGVGELEHRASFTTMYVAAVCVGIGASAQTILAAEFGSLCDSQGTVVWGIFKGSHVTYRFVCDCIGGFHKHHSLDADDNTWARILTEVGEEGSQLVDVGKWLE